MDKKGIKMKKELNENNNNIAQVGAKYIYIKKRYADSNKESLNYIVVSKKVLEELEQLSKIKDYEVCVNITHEEKGLKLKEKKVKTGIKLSKLLDKKNHPHKSGTNEKNTRIKINQLNLKGRFEKQPADIFESEQIVEIIEVINEGEIEEITGVKNRHQKARGKGDIELLKENGKVVVSLKKEEDKNRLSNFSLSSKNLPNNVGQILNGFNETLDKTKTKKEFSFEEEGEKIENMVSNLNDLDVEDKKDFLISMFNLLPDYPTYEIVGDGKKTKLSKGLIYPSQKYLKEKLDFETIKIKRKKTTKGTIFIDFETIDKEGEKVNTTINIREKSSNSNNKLYFGVELTTSGIKEFKEKYKKNYIVKEIVEKDSKDILQEIINYDTKVNMRKELEGKGYKKKGEKYIKGGKTYTITEKGLKKEEINPKTSLTKTPTNK